MNNVFKAYDIRGVYKKDFDEKTAYKLGKAFVLFLKKSSPKIAIGRDFRASSPVLFKYLKQGITDHGGIVYDISLATTPILYFATCFLKVDGGIMITASHNPKEYNGFKIVGKNATPISEKTGLLEIKELLEKEAPKKNGKTIKKNVLKEYIHFVSENFNLKDFDFKIGVDTANAVPSIIVEKLFKKSNLEVFHINKELDEDFKSHDPDPLTLKNLKQVSALMKKENLDLGIAFDGDGDRIVFLDEKGNPISSDIILAVVADVLGKKVLYDIRCSNIVQEVMQEKAEKSRVGHSFIKKEMKDKNIYLGGEYSGHFYLNDKYCFEAPFFILFMLLEQMKLSSKKLSEIVKPYQRYFHSGEINFKLENRAEVIKKIKSKYKDGKKTHIDGLRIDYDDFWFLVRLSNTEPVLRLIIEAKTKTLLNQKKKELEGLITPFSS